VKHVVSATKREVARKDRNRRRRAAEHLEQARIEPPRPYRRVRRLTMRDWHGVETESRPNRKARRRFGISEIGIMTEGQIQELRRERRRQRAHRRRMARR